MFWCRRGGGNPLRSGSSRETQKRDESNLRDSRRTQVCFLGAEQHIIVVDHPNGEHNLDGRSIGFFQCVVLQSAKQPTFSAKDSTWVNSWVWETLEQTLEPLSFGARNGCAVVWTPPFGGVCEETKEIQHVFFFWGGSLGLHQF